MQTRIAISVVQHQPTHIARFATNPTNSTIIIVDSAAREAGLHTGDTVEAIDDRPYVGLMVYWDELRKLTPGDTLKIAVRSPAQTQVRTVLLPVTGPRSWIETRSSEIILNVVVPAFCAVLGFWVVLARPGDRLAWLLLGLLLGLAQMLSGDPASHGLKSALLISTAYAMVLIYLWPVFMFLFGLYFPEPLPFLARWGVWGRRFPWLIITPYFLVSLADIALAIGSLESFHSVEPLYRVLHPLQIPHSIYEFCLIGAFFAFIGTKSGMAISPDARRRLRLLYWGATVALTPLLIVGIAIWLTKRLDLPDWALGAALVLFCLFPLTLAYVIVVQRAMDVRVVLRQGLQYALARGGIRVLQLSALGTVIVTFVALSQHRDTSAKLTVIALGLGAIFVIRRVGDRAGEWVDRRFFREAYDAEQVLGELSDNVRSMVEVPSLLATVAERISQTLHIPQVAVLLGGAGPYRPAYALGYASPPDIAFPPGAGTVKVLERQGGPARVYFDDPQSWLHREPEVTEEDRTKLAQLQSELLLPLNGREQLLGFISLGPKRSDEPYSRTDLRLLKSVATQTGLALENAHLISAIADEVAQRERLNSELEIARDVQERLFPQKLTPIPGIEYAGACRPASGVGGDYYDFLALPGGRLGIAIGDVSGKGIAAALTMASLQASLRSEATRGTDSLAGLMCSVNRLLHEALASNRYATFFYAQYDPETRLLTYVNAGHNPPILFHANDGQWAVSRLEPCGTVVGILQEASYEQRSLTIAPGDVFVGFTDGVSEAMNEAQDEFGEERLIETVRGCARQSPAEIITCIMAGADEFAGGAKQHDDMTLVVLCSAPSGCK